MRPSRTFRQALAIGLLGAIAVVPACSGTATEPDDGSSAAAAIRRVIAEDAELGRIRNHDPETMPIARAAERYVAGLDALDLTGCPVDFREALETHRDAWADIVGYLEDHGDLRGEMHDVFDRIAAEGNPTADVFDARVTAIWDTWADVEAAMREHGVEP